MQQGWGLIYTSNQLHKVEILRAVLQDNNIESVSIDKRDSSYISIGEIEVYVQDMDAPLAKIIIEKTSLD